jgi:hypothetical protein
MYLMSSGTASPDSRITAKTIAEGTMTLYAPERSTSRPVNTTLDAPMREKSEGKRK